jgi:hypothetical protein
MGSVLVVLLLEATRRSIGWPLPVIALIFMAYALFGRMFPGLLQHSGASWSTLVDHLYLTSQGIYGIAVGVVATYVFHFVLFGVLATRIGLGQLFLDIASSIAGRYAGGPGESVGVRLGAVRDAFGLVGRQCRDGRVAHDSGDDPPRLSAAFRGRRRGRLVDRRTDHAARARRGCVPDGRVPQRAVPDDHRRGDRAGVHAFLRRVLQVHFEAKRTGCAASGPTSCRT